GGGGERSVGVLERGVAVEVGLAGDSGEQSLRLPLLAERAACPALPVEPRGLVAARRGHLLDGGADLGPVFLAQRGASAPLELVVAQRDAVGVREPLERAREMLTGRLRPELRPSPGLVPGREALLELPRPRARSELGARARGPGGRIQPRSAVTPLLQVELLGALEKPLGRAPDSVDRAVVRLLARRQIVDRPLRRRGLSRLEKQTRATPDIVRGQAS